MVFGCKAVWLAFSILTGMASPLGNPVAGLECLAWMAGSWASQSERGSAEEFWAPPAGGLMLGFHRDVFPSGEAFFEYLRMESVDGGVIYFASPRGRETTAFRMSECREGYAVFENPEHEFPQKIIYRLEPDGDLCATVEGIEKGLPRQATWCWKAVSP